jgi:hypothetical protein
MVSDGFIYLLKTDAGCKEGHVSLALSIGFSLTSRRGEDALDHGTYRERRGEQFLERSPVQ